MSTEKRRGGYLATTEGVKKLKEAKSRKKYTYAQIQAQIPVTLDQIKRLFNPQWGNGKYKIGEDAVSLICGALDLQPEEIVSNWHVEDIESDASATVQREVTEADTPYSQALQLIEQAVREEATELDLSGLELTELPPEIAQLTNLSVLELDNNQLDSLPPEIAQLTNLSQLYLRDNFLPISPEILENVFEPATIINYYLSLQDSKKPLHEVKMLLVGQGNVGKTCVRERLLRNKYDPTRNKTDGIDIEPWDIKIKDNKYQVNVWDFGGQQIYHATHQFFLTDNSIFVLVWNARTEFNQARPYYWLDMITANAPNAPIILVATHLDQRRELIPLDYLKEKYPKITAFFEVSNLNRQGIDILYSHIRELAANLPLMGKPWLEKWDKATNQLRENAQKLITRRKLFEIFYGQLLDEDESNILAKYLHDLGEILQ
ncbi:MAG: GTP-binding protein, partial [Cyanobacteria bacterium J06631_2]